MSGQRGKQIQSTMLSEVSIKSIFLKTSDVLFYSATSSVRRKTDPGTDRVGVTGIKYNDIKQNATPLQCSYRLAHLTDRNLTGRILCLGPSGWPVRPSWDGANDMGFYRARVLGRAGRKLPGLGELGDAGYLPGVRPCSNTPPLVFRQNMPRGGVPVTGWRAAGQMKIASRITGHRPAAAGRCEGRPRDHPL